MPGCWSNSSGRWQPSATMAYGGHGNIGDTNTYWNSNVPVGANGLRPNEYITYDSTGRPTGITSPYGNSTNANVIDPRTGTNITAKQYTPTFGDLKKEYHQKMAEQNPYMNIDPAGTGVNLDIAPLEVIQLGNNQFLTKTLTTQDLSLSDNPNADVSSYGIESNTPSSTGDTSSSAASAGAATGGFDVGATSSMVSGMIGAFGE